MPIDACNMGNQRPDLVRKPNRDCRCDSLSSTSHYWQEIFNQHYEAEDMF